jgi:hypothetical protein
MLLCMAKILLKIDFSSVNKAVQLQVAALGHRLFPQGDCAAGQD